MSVHVDLDAIGAEKILSLVLKEREMALSVREWKHRLAAYGYGIKETAFGTFVTTLKNENLLCELPA